jgi:hypothetical protein
VWAENDILLLGKKCLVPFLQGVDKSFPLPKKGWVSFPVCCSHWPRPLSFSLLPILNHSFEHTYLTYTFIPFLLWLQVWATCYLKTPVSIGTTTAY